MVSIISPAERLLNHSLPGARSCFPRRSCHRHPRRWPIPSIAPCTTHGVNPCPGSSPQQSSDQGGLCRADTMLSQVHQVDQGYMPDPPDAISRMTDEIAFRILLVEKITDIFGHLQSRAPANCPLQIPVDDGAGENRLSNPQLPHIEARRQSRSTVLPKGNEANTPARAAARFNRLTGGAPLRGRFLWTSSIGHLGHYTTKIF